ncbi:MAG: beta-lactamase family protein [Gemmatimonadota bacterium]|nr:beta-lactamase family protein [Gemmatimonadota bacterium]
MLRPSPCLARLLGSCLLFASGTRLGAQDVNVHFRVALYDARGSYPVAGFTFRVVGQRHDSTIVRTDATGGAQIRLSSGPYHTEPVDGVEFDGVRMVWNVPIVVRPGMELIELSEHNALRVGSALSRPGTTPVVVPAAQIRRVQLPAYPVEERMARVERGLLPAILVRGRASETMHLRARMEHFRVPGVSVAVVDNNRLAWTRSYGVTRARVRQESEAVDSTTLFHAGSASETVSALAALALVGQGKLSLDGDVNRELRSWRLSGGDSARWNPPTLRGLLNESAGVGISRFRGYAWGEPVPSLLQLLQGLAPANSPAVRVEMPPATVRRASAGSYAVLQQLLEDVAGEPFGRLMRVLVLDSLDMRHSRFAPFPPPPVSLHAAWAHHAEGGEVAGRWYSHPELAAAGLWTTAGDLAQVVIELLRAPSGEGRVLSAALATQMLARQPLGGGLGIDLSDIGEPARFGREGESKGYRCVIVGFPAAGQGAVVMTNSESGGALAQEIVRSIAREYGWPAMHPAERQVAAVDPRRYRELVGEYHLESSGQPALVDVMSRRSQLLIREPEGPAVEVIAANDSSYFAPANGTRYTFLRDDHGRVRWLAIALSGAPRVATRVR